MSFFLSNCLSITLGWLPSNNVIALQSVGSNSVALSHLQCFSISNEVVRQQMTEGRSRKKDFRVRNLHQIPPYFLYWVNILNFYFEIILRYKQKLQEYMDSSCALSSQVPWKLASYKISSEVKVAQLCPTLCDPLGFSGQNTGVGSLSLLQGIFPTQGSNPGLPHCRWIVYQLGHKGSPRILEWVAYPFSSGSSWPMPTSKSRIIWISHFYM